MLPPKRGGIVATLSLSRAYNVFEYSGGRLGVLRRGLFSRMESNTLFPVSFCLKAAYGRGLDLVGEGGVDGIRIGWGHET